MYKEIKIGPIADVRIDASEADVSTYIRSGDALLVELRDGRGFVIPEFFKLSDDGFFRGVRFTQSDDSHTSSGEFSGLDSVLAPSGEALTVLAIGVAGLGVAFGTDFSSETDDTRKTDSRRASIDADEILALLPPTNEDTSSRHMAWDDLIQKSEDDGIPGVENTSLNDLIPNGNLGEYLHAEDDELTNLAKDARIYPEGTELDELLENVVTDVNRASHTNELGNPQGLVWQTFGDDLLGIVEIGEHFIDEVELDKALFGSYLAEVL